MDSHIVADFPTVALQVTNLPVGSSYRDIPVDDL